MKKVDFEQGSVVGNIVRTALPMMVAQTISLLYNIVDRIYIGRIPKVGTEALGAVGLCFPIIILIGGFTNMFGLGGAPLFSIALGRQNPKKALAVMNTAFRLEVLTGFALMLLGEPLAEVILRLFGAGEAECFYAVPYARIYLLGTVFSMIATGMNPYINAQGYSMIGMGTVLIGAVANIILDPIFIFTLGMGVNGAAFATVIAQFLSMAVVMTFLLRKERDLGKKPALSATDAGQTVGQAQASAKAQAQASAKTQAQAQAQAGLYRLVGDRLLEAEDKKQMLPYAWEIVSLGTAPFVMQCTNCLVSIACNNVLITVGSATYVSVMTIISSVRQILDTPILAVTEGASPVISYNYGARKPDRVRQAMLVMTVTAVAYTFVMWRIIERFPLLLIRIFSEDTALQQLSLRPLHLYFFAFLFQSFQYCGQTVFKALNKKKQAIFFSIFRKVVMVVPLTFLLPYVFHMGVDGVFIAEPVSNVIGGCACMITMLLTVLPELKRMQNQENK